MLPDFGDLYDGLRMIFVGDQMERSILELWLSEKVIRSGFGSVD